MRHALIRDGVVINVVELEDTLILGAVPDPPVRAELTGDADEDARLEAEFADAFAAWRLEAGRYWTPPAGVTLAEGDDASPGDTWDGTAFTRPVADPTPPTLEEAVDAISRDVAVVEDTVGALTRDVVKIAPDGDTAALEAMKVEG